MKIIICFFLISIWCTTKQLLVCFSKEIKGPYINKVFVVSNGWHTGFVISAPKIQAKIPELKKRFRDTPNIEFGWGDADFYRSNEFSLAVSLSAIFWPTDSVIHSVAVPKNVESFFSDSEIQSICLSDEEFFSLILFISNSFFKDKNGNLEELQKGLYGNSQFYKANDEFHLMNTCNVWTAKGLKSAGFKVSTSNKLTASSIMDFLTNNKKNRNCDLF